MNSLLLLMLTCTPALLAQDPEGKPAFLRVRFVGQEDGLPRPGVSLYQRGDTSPTALAAKTGFVVAEQQRVAWLRHAVRTWRSDPAGEVLLPRALFRDRRLLFAGEPFALSEVGEETDGVAPWKVCETEPVGVRALDSTGHPLANFPVALHTGGRDVSVALTDNEGRALLGMPRDLTARVWLSPAGWIGSRAGMPTIAVSLAGRRGTDLVVPPHGSVLVHATRGGLPVKTRLSGIAVRLTDDWEWALNASPGGEVDGFGFELPFVAVGASLQGHVHLPQSHAFEGKGPQRAGEVAAIGVVIPWRPKVSFRLEGPRLPPFTGVVCVHFVTDAGHHDAGASHDADGEWQINGEVALWGSVLQRIDFDVFASATASSPSCCWSASVPLCADLTTPAFDLGTIELVSSGALRGRVVDAEDRPLAGVEVVAKPKGDGLGYLLRSDAKGRFVWKMAMPRSDHGTPIPLTAMARRGDQRSATVQAAADGGEVVLRLVEPVAAERAKEKPRARCAGTLVATVYSRSPNQNQRWMLRSDSGLAATTQSVRRADGTLEVRFEQLQAGRYTLWVTERDVMRSVLMGLDVPGDGPCKDPRLAQLSLQDLGELKVRALDAQGIPIAGVRVTVSGMILTTDGTGCIRITTHEGARPSGTFERSGLRTREVAELIDGMDVVLQAAKTFRVRVAGLPADVPRERIEIWVRHEERARFLGPRGTPDGNGVVDLPTPQAGRYFVNLLVTPAIRNGSWTLVAIRPEPVAIGDAGAPDVEWQLDAATAQLLRERLQ